jgi:hypothetical protein
VQSTRLIRDRCCQPIEISSIKSDLQNQWPDRNLDANVVHFIMFYSYAFELIPKEGFQSTVVVIMSDFKRPNFKLAWPKYKEQLAFLVYRQFLWQL